MKCKQAFWNIIQLNYKYEKNAFLNLCVSMIIYVKKH